MSSIAPPQLPPPPNNNNPNHIHPNNHANESDNNNNDDDTNNNDEKRKSQTTAARRPSTSTNTNTKLLISSMMKWYTYDELVHLVQRLDFSSNRRRSNNNSNSNSNNSNDDENEKSMKKAAAIASAATLAATSVSSSSSSSSSSAAAAAQAAAIMKRKRPPSKKNSHPSTSTSGSSSSTGSPKNDKDNPTKRTTVGDRNKNRNRKVVKGQPNHPLAAAPASAFSSASAFVFLLPPELAIRVVEYLTIERVCPATVRAVAASSQDAIHPLAACLSPQEDSWWMSANHTMPCGRGHEWVQFAFLDAAAEDDPEKNQDDNENNNDDNNDSDNNNNNNNNHNNNDNHTDNQQQQQQQQEQQQHEQQQLQLQRPIVKTLRRLSMVSMKIPPIPQGPLSVRNFVLQAYCDVHDTRNSAMALDDFHRIIRAAAATFTATSTATSTTTTTTTTSSTTTTTTLPSMSSSSSSLSSGWYNISPIFQLANRTGWQRFPLEIDSPSNHPSNNNNNNNAVVVVVDVAEVRLVCLTNQISAFMDVTLEPTAATLVQFESVGFFSVRFE